MHNRCDSSGCYLLCIASGYTPYNRTYDTASYTQNWSSRGGSNNQVQSLCCWNRSIMMIKLAGTVSAASWFLGPARYQVDNVHLAIKQIIFVLRGKHGSGRETAAGHRQHGCHVRHSSPTLPQTGVYTGLHSGLSFLSTLSSTIYHCCALLHTL